MAFSGSRLTALQQELLGAGSEGVVVDFVRERVPQLNPKVERGGMPMDPPEEIVVNKLCALLGRAEIRDLVDLYCLEQAGWRPEHFLEQAARKDAGMTPATLAWVLSGLPIPEEIPAGLRRIDLVAYASELERRFRARALPPPPG